MSKPSAKSPHPAPPAVARKAPAAATKAAPKKATAAKTSFAKEMPVTTPAAKKTVAKPTATKTTPAKSAASKKLPVQPAAADKPAASAATPSKSANTPKPASARSGAAASAARVEPSPKAVPAPSPNRFAERFSPAKRPARGYPEPMEAAKHAYRADPKLANAWKTKSGRELTEPELMAMPEAEYMKEQQLEFFRMRLQALNDDLLSNAGETTEHLREDTSIVPDPADRATIEEEHALELRTRDRERKLLKKISQSLTRIESGEYGFCDETGEPIGLGRLLARPTATLSLEAQQRRELKQKMFGD